MTDEALRQIESDLQAIQNHPDCSHSMALHEIRQRRRALLSRESGPQERCGCRHQENNHVQPDRPCLLCQCADFEQVVGGHGDVRPLGHLDAAIALDEERVP